MPILKDFVVPASSGSLQVAAGSPLFIAFLASKDPTTKRPWCPDVVAALPTLEATFKGQNQPTVAFVEVGQRPEWKNPNNDFRKKWNVNNVPTLVRYEGSSDGAKEVARLVEAEILDQDRLQTLTKSV